MTRLVADAAIAVVAVLATSAVLVASDSDLTFASVALLVAVVGAAAWSYRAGLVAAVSAAASLTYFFTPPVHSFTINQPDDVLALVAFVAASVVVGATVARLNELRRDSALSAREARLRLAVTHDLAAGVPIDRVLQRLAIDLVELFELSSCRIVVDGAHGQAASDRASADAVQLRTPGLELELALARPLRASDRETIEALVAGVAAALDRARLDREARDQRMRADLDRSRAAFLTAVTHDLRTPIATITTATGALLMPGPVADDDSRRELLEAAHAEAARLERLVTKVLELTRIRTGVRPDRRDVAAADLVQASVEQLGAAANGSAIALDIDPDLPAVHVDPLLMEHVVTNLLENAIRHGSTGGGVEVRARVHRDAMELAVVDHGTGIPPADRERAFEEFVRLGARTDGVGTGLGLTIVRALTDANDGQVRYEDTAGGGATFVLTLPIGQVDEGEQL